MLNIKQIGQTWSEADETHRGPNTSKNYPLAAADGTTVSSKP